MTRHILSVSSGRADVGVLAPVWRALAARDDIKLCVFLTGMHMAADAPPLTGLPENVALVRGGADLGGNTGNEAAIAMAEIGRASADAIGTLTPDMMLVIGDRLDMLPTVVSALPFNLPIAHLHGGEVTEGAIDDRVRHCVSKLAHLHAVSSEGARARLLAMGEEDRRIRVTGAPGLDTLCEAEEIDRAAFCAEVGLSPEPPFRLVTVHPETNSADPFAALNATIAALDARPGAALMTAANSDPGGAEINRRLAEFAAARPSVHLVDTLGSRLYPNALRHAALMIGNSSSGVIEAGLLGLPVINVGDRQKGRERGENVDDVGHDPADVIAALDRLGPDPARISCGSPYGDGRAAPRVADLLADTALSPDLLLKAAPVGRGLAA